MAWQCHPCGVSNAADAEHCQKCRVHWTQVWSRPRRSGSRQTPRQKKEKKQKDKDNNKEKEKDNHKEPEVPAGMAEWQLFPSKVPWINTTPQSRLPPREVTALGDELPPPPSLPAPPQAPVSAVMTGGEKLSQEDQQMLTHLRGIKELSLKDPSMAMPQTMVELLQKLEAREKESGTNRPLTHSHLNQLKKIQSQVATAAKKVSNLDTEWKTFVMTATTRLQHHQEMYAACRQEYVAHYQQKVQELEAAKKNIQAASANLTQEIPAPPEAPIAPDLAPQLEQFSEVAQQIQQQEPWDVSDADDDMKEEDELLKEQPERGRASHSSAMSAFGRTATSPQKVANHLLKAKHESKNEKSKK